MKRIYIVVEGQTEQEFVNSIVAPYLWNLGIFNITPVLIRTSRTGRGGMVSYEHLCNTIRMLLASGKDDFIVTTFIDYFRIPNSMPRYAECMAKPDANQRTVALEAAMDEHISDRRFFSYTSLTFNYTNSKRFCFQIIQVLNITFQKSMPRKLQKLYLPMTIRKTSIHLPKGHHPKDCLL